MSYVTDLFDAMDDDDTDRETRRNPRVKAWMPDMYKPEQMQLRAELRALYGPNRKKENL